MEEFKYNRPEIPEDMIVELPFDQLDSILDSKFNRSVGSYRTKRISLVKEFFRYISKLFRR